MLSNSQKTSTTTALLKSVCALVLGCSAALAARQPVLAPLHVTKSGEGSITSGFVGTTMRTSGTALTLKATPAPGYLFAGWSGTVSSNTATLRLAFQEATDIHAIFVLNPFPAIQGSYSGLVSGPETTGAISFVLMPTGAFSAKLRLQGRQYPLTGTMTPDGHFQTTIARPGKHPLLVELAVDVNGSGTLMGTLTDGDDVAEIYGERSMADGIGMVPASGRYTLLLTPDEGGQPGGYGFATVKVGERGVVSVVGALGDGTPVSATTVISQSGSVLLHLASTNGETAQGRLDFSDEPFNGSMRWMKPAGNGTAGFETTLSATGSVYQAPAAGQLAIDMPSTTNNAEVNFGCDDWAEEMCLAATLNAGARPTITAPGKEKLTLSVNAVTGYVSGRFVDPATRAPRAVRGVMMQSENRAAGFFCGGDEIGSFSLQAWDAQQ